MKKCVECGVPWQPLFLWVSDTLWKKLGYKKTDFVCAHCIIDRIEEHRTFIYAIEGDGEHTIQSANAKIKMTQNCH